MTRAGGVGPFAALGAPAPPAHAQPAKKAQRPTARLVPDPFAGDPRCARHILGCVQCRIFMSGTRNSVPVLNAHGAKVLPSVEIDSYNLEIRDDEGFVGDQERLSGDPRKVARAAAVARTRPAISPPTSQQEETRHAPCRDSEVGGLFHSAVEEFARELSGVIRRFLKVASWRGTEAIVLGGGFRVEPGGRAGNRPRRGHAQGRGARNRARLIANHPDEAGLIGAAHLMPSWIEGFDGLLCGAQRHQYPRCSSSRPISTRPVSESPRSGATATKT